MAVVLNLPATEGVVLENLSSFLFASIALIVSPGPAPLLIAATSASYGWKRALILILGLVSSMCLIIFAVGKGVTRLVILLPEFVSVISTIAIAYMCYLAYRIGSAPPLKDSSDKDKAPTYWNGFFLNFINPKAYGAIGALFSGFTLVSNNPMRDALSKSVLIFLVICIGNLGWMLAGSALSPFMRRQKSSRIINVAFAVALLFSVLLAFFG